MENIIKKLEGVIGKYLDEIETKPIKTLVITFIIYYLCKLISKRT